MASLQIRTTRCQDKNSGILSGRWRIHFHFPPTHRNTHGEPPQPWIRNSKSPRREPAMRGTFPRPYIAKYPFRHALHLPPNLTNFTAPFVTSLAKASRFWGWIEQESPIYHQVEESLLYQNSRSVNSALFLGYMPRRVQCRPSSRVAGVSSQHVVSTWLAKLPLKASRFLCNLPWKS